jgi:hypothetical protein
MRDPGLFYLPVGPPRAAPALRLYQVKMSRPSANMTPEANRVMMQ